MLIVCEGPMGAGKTSLTRILAQHFQASQCLETPGDNPFLAELYRGHRHALATELHFLLQRQQQWQTLPATLCFSDHGPDKDLLFSAQTLDAQERELYLRIRAEILPQTPNIALMIFLDAPVDTLYARIAARGDQWDQALTRDYLAQIRARYDDYFSQYAGNCLDLRGQDLDFVARAKDATILTDLVGNKLHELGWRQ
ncbi:deoxynucleoside kinase [Acidithiobacillus acidisediminis]|uniref:deoxynucleoside kinase n=1 Tax=Acidithiobacillus acidisediminis TaxID=2937799 RepID=UPI0020107C85|nr:deoxynucleoside kinase [Acidithiobacillus sp. S30A2]